jgi:2-polyprenyl-3-methyl-5-hydroxy-6-metoxy-1,4-benzoquinol methylase
VEKRIEMMDTRQIVCNACGADRFVALSNLDSWTIGRCGACGLVYVNPAPFFEPTDEFSAVSREFEYTEYMHQPITEGILAFERRQLAASLALISGFEPSTTIPGRQMRFLDIGCGSGASVRAATDLGWEALGLDIDPELIREGRDQLNVDLRCVPVLESDLPAGSFDFVRLRDVIEHLPNPLDVSAKVGELLAPGGVALFVTPNEGGLATRTRVLLRRRRALVATVPPPHHLHSFDPDSLERTMRRAGLVPRTTFTTVPTDWRYVTSHNMARAKSAPILRPIWRVGQALGMGAVLVSWAQRQ